MDELISVIVPVYNVEPYLPDCLDSILASTYSNLEIIVVDDGSPDNCPAICDEYAGKDSRIRVIHQNNKGIVGARNAGLAVASGTYIGFVDSDDVISPIMYEMMVSAMERTGAEMAACECCRDIKDLITLSDQVKFVDRCLDTFDMRLAMLTNAPQIRDVTWSFCFVCNKLYLKKKLEDSFSAQCLMGEDLEFNYRYIGNCNKTVIVSANLYMYRPNPCSATSLYLKSHKSGVFDAKVVKYGISNFEVWQALANCPSICDKALREYVGGRAAYVSHNVLWQIYASKAENDYPDFCTNASDVIKRYCRAVWRDKETYSCKFRIICLLCGKCFPIWKLMVRVHGKIVNKNI